MRRLALLAWAALAACSGESRAELQANHGVPDPRPRTFVYEIDAERVKALGWASPDADEERTKAAVVTTLEERLPFLAQEKHALVAPDVEGARIRVSFDHRSPLTESEARRVTQAIESVGKLEFFLMPTDEELARPEGRAADHERSLTLPRRHAGLSIEPARVRLPASFAETFGAGNIEALTSAVDAQGYPALAFEFADAEVSEDFRSFTARHVGVRLAVVIHDQIRSAPTIAEALPGVGLIVGLEGEAEAASLARQFTSEEGPLRRVR